MKTEFEVVFRSIDRDVIRGKLRDIGAICTKENTLMKRAVFRTAESQSSFLRVRDEGSQITCTYKEISDKSSGIDQVKELETVIQDYETMVQILKKSGLTQKSYQETYREVWEIENEVEFMIDLWPGLNPFIEIESHSEENVKKYSELLGFDYSDGIFGTTDEICLIELGIPKDVVNNISEISFDKPLKKFDNI